MTPESLQVTSPFGHLLAHVVDNELVQLISEFDDEHLDELPEQPRASIQGGDRGWEDLIADRGVPLIKGCGCPGLVTRR